MGIKLKATIDLDTELEQGRLSAGDLVELLCGDYEWSKYSLSDDDKNKLREFVAYLDGDVINGADLPGANPASRNRNDREPSRRAAPDRL